MHLLFLIEHLVQELLTIITTLYARFDRTSWGHSIIAFALKGGGKESIQMRTYANRGEGNVCIFFFLIEHLVQELLTVITTLYARKQKQTAKISRKIYSVKI